MTQPSLQHRLRALQGDPALEGAFVAPQGRVRRPFKLYGPGLASGSLVQLQGPAATEAALQFLAATPGLKAWVEARISAYPPGWVQRGVDLTCLLFVESPDQFPWAVTELLRSQAFQAVALASPLPDGLALRRLQLAAEGSGAVLLLLAPLPAEAWAVRTRLWCQWQDGQAVVSPVTAEERAAEAGA